MKNRKFIISLLSGLLAAALLLNPLADLIPISASAASSSEIREQINALEAKESEIQGQIDELRGQLSENLSEMQAVVEQKKLIDQEIFLMHTRIANINEQIAAYGVLIADKQSELDASLLRQEELTVKNKERIRSMEEDGSLSYWSVLFKSSSFSDLLDRLNMIQEIAAADQRRLQEMREAAAAVADARDALESEKASLEATKAELDAANAELSAKQDEADALLADLRSRGMEFEAMMAEAEANVEVLMAEIAAQEAAYDTAVMEEYWATYVPPETTAPPEGSDDEEAPEYTGGQDAPSDDGGWICPVPWYVLTSPFGYRVHPIYGDWRFHSGVDLACSEGTPIYAARSGKVISAGWNDSMGYYVQINHGDGFSSIYMHMTHFVVSSGEYVSQGEVIGYVGSTGDSTGDHLHFGISYYGEYVNPMEYI